MTGIMHISAFTAKLYSSPLLKAVNFGKIGEMAMPISTSTAVNAVETVIIASANLAALLSPPVARCPAYIGIKTVPSAVPKQLKIVFGIVIAYEYIFKKLSSPKKDMYTCVDTSDSSRDSTIIIIT